MSIPDGIKVYEKDELLVTRTHEPLNPHPSFPQWSGYDIYPYQFMGTVQRCEMKKIYRMVYLENEFLKVCIAPDIGGRVWFIYDKILKKHLINYSSQVWIYHDGFGLNYACGGLEVSYPLHHSYTTARKREYKILKGSKDSVSVIIGEYEQIYRTRWFIKYTLYLGRSYLEQRVRIYNLTPLESRYMYWANCGIPVSDDVQFIFPESNASMHGHEKTIFSWPIWKQKDISYWKNVTEQLGLYMLNASKPYFGYYNHKDNYGFVHYADLSDLPGKKCWNWGSLYSGRVVDARYVHPDGKPYAEIQAGRVVIQEHTDVLPPETKCDWKEYWYPIRNTGVVSGVSKDVSVNVEISKSNNKTTDLSVKVIGSGYFQNVMVIVNYSDKKELYKDISINPISATVCNIHLPYKITEKDLLSVKIVNEDGEILTKADLYEVSRRDSWSEITPISKEVEPVGVEEIFQQGYVLARDWGNHDEMEKYKEALRLDPGFSYAHLEIGKIDIFRGNYESSIEHLKKVLHRNSGNFDAYYYLGVAYMFAGKLEEALRALELSSKYDTELRSRTRLAEIKIKQGDLHHALRYLEHVNECAPQLTYPLGLRAICLRHLRRLNEAYKIIKKAIEVEPMDPFLQIERIFIEKELKKVSTKELLKELLNQVRMYEPPLLEVAFCYGNIGFYEESLEVLDMIPGSGTLALVYKAYLEYKCNSKEKSQKSLLKALRLNSVGQYAWRLEMIPVLKWAIEKMSMASIFYFHLGNLLVSKRRLDEGITMWHKAERLNEKCYILYSNLGYYESKINKNFENALKYFQKASRLCQDDIYMKLELFNALKRVQKVKVAVKMLEQDIEFVKKAPELVYLLLIEYMEKKEYEKFDRLVKQVDFSINWQIPGPHILWYERYVKEGLKSIEKGDYKRAIELFRKSKRIPPNLGMMYTDVGILDIYWDKTEDERTLYHIGRCYEKLGDIKKAVECWEKAVSIKRVYAWEKMFCREVWLNRYFQAFALKKLGRENEAETILDGLELFTNDQDVPVVIRKRIIELVKRGRFAAEDKQDPFEAEKIEDKIFIPKY